MANAVVDVTVRLDREMSGRIEEVVGALEAKGLVGVQAHARFMIVNGSVAPGQIDALRSVAGVQSVRQDKTYGVKS